MRESIGDNPKATSDTKHVSEHWQVNLPVQNNLYLFNCIGYQYGARRNLGFGHSPLTPGSNKST